MSKIDIMVVGPLVSQHIQAWFSKFPDPSLICVTTVHDGGAPLPEGMSKTVFQPSGSRLDFFLFAPVFWLLWWWHRPRVTNFHYISSYGLLSLLLPKKNLVLNVWGSDVNFTFKTNSFKRFLVRRALRRFSWINAPAEHLKQKLVMLGADESKIEVFQYGVNINTLPLKADTNKQKLIFVSNRNWQSLYRIPLIVEAFCLWRRQQPELSAELHVYGGGSAKNAATIQQVLVQYQDVQHSVVIKGYTDKEQMLQQISHADVFISVPERDGTPLSLLEAMHIGLLPVVSAIDANYEWLDDETGLWVEESSPAAMVNVLQNAVRKLADNSWLAKNREKVLNRASLTVNVQRFYQVLLTLAKAS